MESVLFVLVQEKKGSPILKRKEIYSTFREVDHP